MSALLLMLALPSLAQDEAWERVPTGEVTAVVVFPDRAAVTRTLEVQLQPGLNEVVFADLPPTLQEHTLQAEGEGVEGASLLGLDVVSRELAEDRRARVSELQARIQEVQDGIRTLQDQQTAANQELAFLQQLKAASAKQLSAELLFAGETVAQAESLAELLRTRVPEVQARVREAQLQQRERQAELAALQRELSTVRGAAQWSRRDVTVQLDSPTEGTASVSLTYVLPGASWTPTYDLRASLDEESVELALSALVVQTTGEDWSDVGLTLSTAQPSRGLTPPRLDPFWLEQGWSQPVLYDEWSDDDGLYEEAEEEGMLRADKEAEVAPAPLATRAAQVSERAVATTFEVPGGSSVPGEGTRRKLLITELDLDVELVHVVVPRHEEAAFLVGRTTWEQGWPLLAGRAAAFLDGAFVGMQDLAQTGTGAELTLGFGRDDAISVEVELLEERTSKPDWLGKQTYTGRWAWTLRTGRDKPVAVELLDRVPVSKEYRYLVQYLGEEPDETTSEGIYTFHRQLVPGDDQELEFGYRVRYPRKAPPGGLP